MLHLLTYDNFPFLEFFAATGACLSVYLYGNGSKKAQWVGLVSQTVWWWWAIRHGLYFIMLLNIFMTITHIRNIFKMRRRKTK